MKDWSADYAPVESGSYTYDNDGNILSRNFVYSSSPLEEYHQLYTYQANNNKLSQVSVNDNGANTTYNYSYNGIGNLVADSRTGITGIQYNHKNLPVILTKDGSQIHYRYDEKGQRLWKFAGSTMDYYLRDHNGRELALFNLMTGRMESANIYGNGLIGKVDITYTSAPDYGTERNDHRHYFLKDHLGTIRVTIDADGEVTSAQEYYPYGAYLGNLTYNLSENNARYKFTEKERDFETGYDYFGARFFDSFLGRWHSVDPLADEYPGLSPFNYCANNPIIRFDPDGRFFDVIVDIAFILWDVGELSYDLATTGKINYVAGTALMLDVACAFTPGMTGGGPMYRAGEEAAERMAREAGEEVAEKIVKETGENLANKMSSGKYVDIPDPNNVGPGKNFTKSQKKQIKEANRQNNGGNLVSDGNGELLVPSKQSKKGVTPPPNEVQIDHIIPKSRGGTNSSSNAQVLSRKENLKKSDK